MAPHVQRSLPTKKSRETIFKEIINQCKLDSGFDTQSSDLELVYCNVNPTDGQVIAESLKADSIFERSRGRINYNPVTEVLRVKIMTSEIHEAPVRWLNTEFGHMMRTGWLTAGEIELMDFGSPGPEFHGFQGRYIGAKKTADWICRADTDRFPRILVEVGWTEIFPRLRQDKDLWIRGAADVQLVILVNWNKLRHGRVNGTVEVWGRDNAGDPMLIHEEQIFPGGGNQVIPLTRGQIFGNSLLPNRNANDVWNLEVSRLRVKAGEKLAAMSLTPAT
ncbi:hypothetical protein Egran_05145 [Elaphomyces granulatus]|uniref:Uncharacterized protein n=1 Tax=Elaphomyces granulatus TaxID=519963 RepID=A0A232LSF3_9EURO|nr:hypothetical protein Egran_05145 [Elaphomyces granulatus]